MVLPPRSYDTPQFQARMAETKLTQKGWELQKEFTTPVPILYIIILVVFILFVLAAYGVHFF